MTFISEDMAQYRKKAKEVCPMSLGQLNIFGKDKVQVAIERLQMFEPRDGYYLAFSGGKDSECIKELAIMAGVKFDAHYNKTTVDPPELVRHIRDKHPDVIFHSPEMSMWELIEDNMMPPTRLIRYCCKELKEGGGHGRTVVTGVRWAESPRRKKLRSEVEFDIQGSQSKKANLQREIFLNSDNDERRKMMETCVIKGKRVVNPIVDWDDGDVWEFIGQRGIEVCNLYNEGFARLGCIGCPFAGPKLMKKEFKRWPKFYRGYLRAFDRMLVRRKERGIKRVNEPWETAEDVMKWWLKEK